MVNIFAKVNANPLCGRTTPRHITITRKHFSQVLPPIDQSHSILDVLRSQTIQWFPRENGLRPFETTVEINPTTHAKILIEIGDFPDESFYKVLHLQDGSRRVIMESDVALDNWKGLPED